MLRFPLAVALRRPHGVAVVPIRRLNHDKSTLYSNFQSRRELPRIERRWPAVLGVTAVVVAGWAAFLTYVTNETKCTSSVVKQIVPRVVVEWLSHYSWPDQPTAGERRRQLSNKGLPRLRNCLFHECTESQGHPLRVVAI
uniref:Uncharacterized protein n=1 Tax=Mycena chlorophos TaxID=658473 RepID=A0ABQ0KXK4_MYCCL|nr:predicted protein [Mycena chlorophos]